ncbi:MAG TPA: amidohydrolase family protein [Woeseiaceae bacterium]|nr:amidohydrolase family protein [Woeseiaceae bacterium]
MSSGNSRAVLIFAAFWAAGCADAPEADVDLLVRNVTVVSPELDKPLADAWVAISDGKIAGTGTGKPPMAGRATLEGEGRFLTPGLIDSHVHLAAVPGMNYPPPAELQAIVDAYAEQLPKSYLYFGYTTLIDLAVMDRAFLDNFESTPLHPDLFDCDGPLVIANGYPMAFLPPETRFDHFPNFLYDARQADAIPKRYSPKAHTPAAAVSRVAAHGGICVKTHWETGFGPLRGLPTPSEETISAIMDSAASATENGLVVTMHANSLDGHRFAVNAGVDVIVHGLWNAPAGPDGSLHDDVVAVLDATLGKNIGYMPTMQVLNGMGLMFDTAFLDDPNLAAVLPAALIRWYRTPEGRWFADELRLEFDGMEDTQILGQFDSAFGPLATSQKTVAYLAERNGRLLFGSDTPSSPTFGNPPGYNGFLEMQNLVEAGVSLPQLLSMATIDNAEAFGIDDRYGTVEPGKVANLLLLDADPLQSVDAWNSISTVILHGDPVERQSLAAQDHPTAAPGKE